MNPGRRLRDDLLNVTVDSDWPAGAARAPALSHVARWTNDAIYEMTVEIEGFRGI